MADEDKNKKKTTRKMRNRPKFDTMEYDDEEGQLSPATSGGGAARKKPSDEKKDVTKKKRTVRKGRNTEYSPKVVQHATEFIQWAAKLGVDGLAQLYRNELAHLKPEAGQRAPSFEANPSKNRFQDVICLEETRVRLRCDLPDDKDYIHANYVRFNKAHDRTYICTQAPMENTIEDFWRMVVQEESPVVVNLTMCCENGVAKCAQYWPLEAGESRQFGRFTVTTKRTESEEPQLHSFVLEVLADGCSNAHVLRLIHCTAWPDGGTLTGPKQTLRIIRQVHKVDPVAQGPVVLHCSAGIGRTGTLVLIDYLLFRLFQFAAPHGLQEAFLQLRRQRASSVQREGQFVFVAVCVAFYITRAIACTKEVLDAATELEHQFKLTYNK